MAKIFIVLKGDHGGELDRKEVPPDADVNKVVIDALVDWTLNAGDTITIAEEDGHVG